MTKKVNLSAACAWEYYKYHDTIFSLFGSKVKNNTNSLEKNDWLFLWVEGAFSHKQRMWDIFACIRGEIRPLSYKNLVVNEPVTPNKADLMGVFTIELVHCEHRFGSKSTLGEGDEIVEVILKKFL